MIERKEIGIDNLIIDTAQSRQGDWAGDEQDQRLVNSLERDGLLQSLLVRPVENTPYAGEVSEEYAIVAGSRRYHAAVEAGFDTVHCRIIEADDFEAAKKSFKENEERKDLTGEERARSILLQYQLREPSEPWDCPDCLDSFSSSKKLDAHLRTSASCERPSHKRDGQEDSFTTKQQLKRHIGEVHFPETERKVKKVDNLLRISKLPSELRALFKPESDRNPTESDALENFGVDRDLTASRGGDVSRLGKEVVKLHSSIKQNTDSEALNPTNAVLETVGRLDFDQSETDLQQEIKRFSDEVDRIAEIDDPQKQEREFRARLEDHETQIRELNEELGQPSMPRVNFRLSDLADQDDRLSAQQYRRYHARVKQQLGVESNAEVARRAYRQYLIEQADKNGWN
jgi:hypothetical protein